MEVQSTISRCATAAFSSSTPLALHPRSAPILTQLRPLKHRSPPRRRPRPPALVKAVFIWSDAFDDETESEEDQDADSSDALNDPETAENDLSDTNLAADARDAWYKPRPPSELFVSVFGDIPGSAPPPSDDVAPFAAARPKAPTNELYVTLRDQTRGPEDIDRLRSLVSESAVDASSRVVMSLLGTIPGDMFEVTVTSDRLGLVRLMHSSLATGYALRNAEVRMLLNDNMAPTNTQPRPSRPHRNVSDPSESHDVNASSAASSSENNTAPREKLRKAPPRLNVDKTDLRGNLRWWDADRQIMQEMPAADYVQKLEAENDILRERLSAAAAYDTDSNKLVEFMKTLKPERIAALPADISSQAKDAFKRLVRSVLGDVNEDKVQASYSTARDYLAQITLWCLFAGYVVRNVEKRLELNKIFGETEAIEAK